MLIPNNNIEKIRFIVSQVREEYSANEGIDFIFENHCDAVSEILRERLISEGFDSVKTVSGQYVHTYPDSEEDAYGHHWLEYNGLIIDATRCQFDSTEFVVFPGEQEDYNAEFFQHFQ